MESSTMETMAGDAELAENGSSIEEMTEEQPEETPPVLGASRQLSLIAGGEEPTSASMKLKGGSIPLEGEFEKGDLVKLTVEARVTEVHFIDLIDKSGYVLGAERKHVARLDSVQRA